MAPFKELALRRAILAPRRINGRSEEDMTDGGGGEMVCADPGCMWRVIRHERGGKADWADWE